MSYPVETTQILEHRGYEDVIDFDFFLYPDSSSELVWYHPSTKPTDTEVQGWRPDWLRDVKADEIDGQVPSHTGTDLIRDPVRERDVKRYAAAAVDRARGLEETADDDLDAFDTALKVGSPQEDLGYATLVTSILEVTPWQDRPDDVLGWVAVLTTDSADAEKGGEARIQILDGPDTGAVIPFVQDVSDPTTWSCESRDGFKWSDPEQSVSLQLLWGLGSLPVSPTIRLERLYDRRSDIVRYGSPAGSGGNGDAPKTWINSGQTVTFAQGNIVRVADTSQFIAGEQIRINDIEFTVSSVHSSIDLIVDPASADTSLNGHNVWRYVASAKGGRGGGRGNRSRS